MLLKSLLQIPGVEVRGSHFFRVVRDADVEIRELEAADLMSSIRETLRLRRFGDPVLLEVRTNMPKPIRMSLMSMLNLDDTDVFVVDGLIGFGVFDELYKVDGPRMRFPAFAPSLPDQLATTKGLFETISAGDVLVHHPYDSFGCVEEFVASAVTDPDTIGVKQTLYRVGTESKRCAVGAGFAEAGPDKLVILTDEYTERERIDPDDALGPFEPGDALLVHPGLTRGQVELGAADDERAHPLAEAVVGVATEIDEAGHLVVRTSAGPRTVSAGDVVHLRPG